MNSLPPEIALEIFGYTEKSDQHQLRLVCKAFSLLLIPQLFGTGGFWLDNESVERLLERSRHKYISPHLKHLIFGFEYFSPEIAENQSNYLALFPGAWFPASDKYKYEYVGKKYSLIDAEWASKLAAVEKLKPGYVNYRKLCAPQEVSQRSGAFVKSLVEALNGFPCLQSITLRINEYHLSPGAITDRRLEPPFPLGSLPDPGVFITVISALAQLSRPLQELTVVCYDASSAKSPIVPSHEWPLISEAFRNLRRLSLDIDRFEYYLSARELQMLYTATPNLEHLSVDFRGAFFGFDRVIEGRPDRFPYLRRLELSGVETTWRVLMATLLPHATTLRTLHLTDIFLGMNGIRGAGLWVGVLEFLRDKLQLEEAKFEGLWWDRHFLLRLSSTSMWENYQPYLDFTKGKIVAEDYVVRKGEVNPFMEMEEGRRAIGLLDDGTSD
ncbi:MAG: hypothetical protein M1839_002234 [Geoglossum umbratile]|nr:MAG: hypothetical protein M1839_002234 [Geoglossum umbratile]